MSGTPFEVRALGREFEARLDPSESPGFGGRRGPQHDDLFRRLIRQEGQACPERGELLSGVREQGLEGLRRARRLYESCLSSAAGRHLLRRRQAALARREAPALRRRIARLEAQLGSEAAGLEARKAAAGQEERVRQVEWSFLEDQLLQANRQMTRRIEEHADGEHRWLD